MTNASDRPMARVVKHPVILDGETLASIVLVREDGKYGAEVTCRGQAFCIACEFSTVTGVLAAVEAKLARALLISR